MIHAVQEPASLTGERGVETAGIAPLLTLKIFLLVSGIQIMPGNYWDLRTRGWPCCDHKTAHAAWPASGQHTRPSGKCSFPSSFLESFPGGLWCLAMVSRGEPSGSSVEQGWCSISMREGPLPEGPWQGRSTARAAPVCPSSPRKQPRKPNPHSPAPGACRGVNATLGPEPPG